jgi:hypothetical protein
LHYGGIFGECLISERMGFPRMPKQRVWVQLMHAQGHVSALSRIAIRIDIRLCIVALYWCKGGEDKWIAPPTYIHRSLINNVSSRSLMVLEKRVEEKLTSRRAFSGQVTLVNCG